MVETMHESAGAYKNVLLYAPCPLIYCWSWGLALVCWVESLANSVGFVLISLNCIDWNTLIRRLISLLVGTFQSSCFIVAVVDFRLVLGSVEHDPCRPLVHSLYSLPCPWRPWKTGPRWSIFEYMPWHATIECHMLSHMTTTSTSHKYLNLQHTIIL